LLGAVFANGGAVRDVRLLSPEITRLAGQPQATGQCPYLGGITWGLGFGLHNPAFPAPTPTSLHWGGFGGSWMLADPRARVSLGYAPNNFRLDEDEKHDRRLGRFWRVLRDLLPGL
jgi:CubicO group peptidase (beta-lactamase class C family)